MSLQTSKFFKTSWRLHLLDGTDFLRIKMNSFACHNKSKELATGYPKEGFDRVHLQLMRSHDVEYLL